MLNFFPQNPHIHFQLHPDNYRSSFHLCNFVFSRNIFWIRILSLSLMFLRFIHISTCVQNTFVFISSIPLYGYITFWLSKWAYGFSPQNTVIVNYAYNDNYRNTLLWSIIVPCAIFLMTLKWLYILLFSLKRNSGDPGVLKQSLLWQQLSITAAVSESVSQEGRPRKVESEVLSEGCLPRPSFCSCCFVLLFVHFG